LTAETLDFLWKAGLDFEVSKQRLLSTCRNFPLEIYFIRDDDIPNYIGSKIVDLGIIGQNILFEKRPKVKKLLNLRYCFCSLVVAVPKDSNIKTVSDLNSLRVATSYPESAKIFFDKYNLKVSIVTINGSVEIAPNLGFADAIVDLSSSGSTLAMQELRVVSNIFDSEAVLIADPLYLKSPKSGLVEQLISRFKSVLSAKQYKLVIINSAQNILPKLYKFFPYLKRNQLSKSVNIQTVIKEDLLWESIPRLKKLGVKDIYILPIEKIIS